MSTTFTATWGCTSLCKCFSCTDWGTLQVAGKLCRGGRVRLAWKGPGSSSERLLSAEEASSPLAAKTLSLCPSCSMSSTCILVTAFCFGVALCCWPCHTAVTGSQGGSFLPSSSPAWENLLEELSEWEEGVSLTTSWSLLPSTWIMT